MSRIVGLIFTPVPGGTVAPPAPPAPVDADTATAALSAALASAPGAARVVVPADALRAALDALSAHHAAAWRQRWAP